MEQISIRSIQHYLYCPHRWGLCEIEKLWQDNLFVAHADLIHARVHDAEYTRSLRGVKTFCGVSVYHDAPAYGLYGITDCIEARKSSKGISLPGEEGLWQLCIVEYKPTKPKTSDYHSSDLMQVFAQKICVDYIFQCDCDAELYYDDVRKRISLPVKEYYNEFDADLKKILIQMRDALASGTVPPIPKGQKCSGCSLKDICIPIKKIKGSVYDRLEALLKEDG